MGEDDQQQSRLFYDLCAFALLLVHSPHIFFPSVGASSLCGTSQRSEISPASLASLFHGASLVLMLCGSITFVLSCTLMPWVIGFVILLYFLGFVSSLSEIGKAILFPHRTCTWEDGDEGGPRDHAYPRPIALVVSQGVMAVGHFFIGMGWPGAMYIGTLVIGLGFGAHWAIVPATASELFGMRNFGSLYNFLTCANPAGSLIFSELIASNIYDYEASKQAQKRQQHGDRLAEEVLKCEGAVCFFLSSMIMSGFTIIAVILSLVLVYRTKIVYSNLYEKNSCSSCP